MQQGSGPTDRPCNDDGEAALAFWTLFLLFLVLLADGPWWPYSRGWGATPAAVILGILLVWLIVILVGGVPFAWPWAATVTAPDLPR